MGVGVAAMPTRSLAGVAALVLGICGFALGPSDFYNQAFGAGAFYRVMAWGIPASLAVYGARSLESFFEKRSFSLPVLLGSASYSIYLFHQLVFLAFSGLAGLVISAFAGVAVYLALERPIMRVKPHWRPPGESHPASASLLT
jgi:exopolysaccharide production protein ExoZ